jgi:hypothetical protein
VSRLLRTSAARPRHELHRQPIGILEHERPRIAEGVRRFEDLDPRVREAREGAIEIVDRERDVVERLAS